MKLDELKQKLERIPKLHQKRIRSRLRRESGADRIIRTRSQLKAEYGLSLEAYNLLRCEQRFCCAICGRHENEIKHNSQKLVVHHDHDTKEIRGLLCHRCNVGLGAFRDDPELLDKAKSFQSNPVNPGQSLTGYLV
jgi:hypothetical protein